MSSKSFIEMFGDVALKETRSLTISEDIPDGLPADDYGFTEWYCVDPACDCRRVLFIVVAHHRGGHLATISHSFDPPGKRALVPEQTFLDPLLPQSELAEDLLELCKDVLMSDTDYCQRLERHYRMVKDAIADPDHPCHRSLGPDDEDRARKVARARAILPPKRRGKRKWR
jgi:hypothetical protein